MGEQKKRDLETLPEQDLGHEPGSVATTALGQDQKAEASVGDEAKHYLQGFKLYSLVLSLTFAAFLVLLDVAILGTVSRTGRSPSFLAWCWRLMLLRPYQESQLTSEPLQTLGGMEVLMCYASMSESPRS
jgi:hypothetical protein